MGFSLTMTYSLRNLLFIKCSRIFLEVIIKHTGPKHTNHPGSQWLPKDNSASEVTSPRSLPCTVLGLKSQLVLWLSVREANIPTSVPRKALESSSQLFSMCPTQPPSPGTGDESHLTSHLEDLFYPFYLVWISLPFVLLLSLFWTFPCAKTMLEQQRGQK